MGVPVSVGDASTPGDARHAAIRRSWIDLLTPEDPSRELAPASTWTFGEARKLFGKNAIRWGAEVAHGMTEHIMREAPDFAGGEGPFETIRIGTEAYIWRAMLLLATNDRSTGAVTPETTIGVHDFVRRGIPMEVVLRGIQLGHGYGVRRFIRACEQIVPSEDRAREMGEITNLLLDFFDQFSTHISSEYLAERERWVASGGATREDLVRGVLAHEPVDLRAAEFTLGYALGRTHTAIVVESDRAAAEDSGELQRTASQILHHIGCAGTLVIPVGGTTVWAWGSTDRDATVELARLADHRVGPAIHVAVGLPAAGVAGFVRSHEQAVHASRLSSHMSGESRPWLSDFAQLELGCLLSADPTLAADFVERELGGLYGDTPDLVELRRTLLAYLDAERSVNAAAKRLHVARNTVSYRVKKAEGLRKASISERQLELHAALRLASHLGPQRPKAAQP